MLCSYSCDAAVEGVARVSDEFLAVEVAGVVEIFPPCSREAALLEERELLIESAEEELAFSEGALDGLVVLLAEFLPPGFVLAL